MDTTAAKVAVWLVHSGALPENGPRISPDIERVRRMLQNSISKYGLL